MQILHALQTNLPALSVTKAADDGSTAGVRTYTNFVDQILTGELVGSMKCIDTPDQPPQPVRETFQMLRCHISVETNYLMHGLQESLTETVEKRSEQLGRDAKYHKTLRISRLPAYLIVQFVRFFWKAESRTNAKIMRNVRFSMTLDLYELCDAALKERLKPVREQMKRADDERLARAQSADAGPVDGASKEGPRRADPTAVPPATEPYQFPSFSFRDDLGSNNSGLYDLIAVLTHKGRTSNSGHYVGWVCGADGNWFKFDDDDVSMVTPEDVLKLSGGGTLCSRPRMHAAAAAVPPTDPHAFLLTWPWAWAAHIGHRRLAYGLHADLPIAPSSQHRRRARSVAALDIGSGSCGRCSTVLRRSIRRGLRTHIKGQALRRLLLRSALSRQLRFPH